MILNGEDGNDRPACPSCGTGGIENIVSSNSVRRDKKGDKRLNEVYCLLCGYIYGVFGKIENIMSS
jgi:hypothetical protein